MKWYIILLLCLSMLLCSCNKNTVKEVSVSLGNDSIKSLRCGERARLSTELFNAGANFPSEKEEFVYQAKQGTIENGVYIAPETSGEDIITITHTPSKTSKTIKISIRDALKMVVELPREFLMCNESVELAPNIFDGKEKQKAEAKEFQYLAKLGKFEGALYQAPDVEVKDTIQIIHAKTQTQKILEVEIKAKPALVVEKIPATVLCNNTITIEAYLQKPGKRIEIATGELQLTAKLGNFSDRVYTAPTVPGEDVITVLHIATEQKKEFSISVQEDVSLQVSAPKEQVLSFEKMKIKVNLVSGGQIKELSSDAYEFSAKKGKFAKDIYEAPEKEGSDLITVVHKESGLKKEIELKVKYSPFRPVKTDLFEMEIPSKWNVLNTDMGFVATSYKGQLRWERHGSEIKALALTGFDFLDPQTIIVLFQQQGGMGKNMEKVNEEQITLADQSATRVTYESTSGKNRKSWWIVFKREGAVFLLTFSGEFSFFEGNDPIPDQILKNFKFAPRDKSTSTNLIIHKKRKKEDHEFFNIQLPEVWKTGRLYSIMFASSKVSIKGEKIALFILGYRSKEIQSMDLSLILLLFRQETVKDPSMKVTNEKELSLSGTKAQMMEFIGGQGVNQQKMWIVAVKHKFTGYAIIIRGPQQIWDANPNFANEIVQSFRPK